MHRAEAVEVGIVAIVVVVGREDLLVRLGEGAFHGWGGDELDDSGRWRRRDGGGQEGGVDGKLCLCHRP